MHARDVSDGEECDRMGTGKRGPAGEVRLVVAARCRGKSGWTQERTSGGGITREKMHASSSEA